MSELREKHELLLAEGTSINPLKAKEITEFLYADLTILDSKASALMSFDGILTAVASFTVQDEGILARQPLIPLIAIVLGLLAACLCLFVAQISYPFLGKVRIVAGPPRGLEYSEELNALDGAVIWRTCFYRTAWWLSLGAVVLFLIMFVVALWSSL